MIKQYAFYYDANRCVKCHACEIACKSIHNVEAGIQWRKVSESWSGAFPAVRRTFLSLACMHCAVPACGAVCPTGAIVKRAEDGIVTVDKALCNGCRDCYNACPFDIPQFGSDGTMQKCDFCLDTGNGPACAAACPAEALSYGSLNEFADEIKAGTISLYEGKTGPSLVIKNRRSK